jgi:hypothetical protein
VRISFDPAKSERNGMVRGLPFDRVADFDFATAIYGVDTRRDYGETRYVAMGFLDGRLHVLCFTEIEGGIRVVSLRRANLREVRRYEQETTD